MIPVWLGVLLFVLGTWVGFGTAALLVAGSRDLDVPPRPPRPVVVDGDWSEAWLDIIDKHRDSRTPG